jgi:hypothetical protein
MCFLQGDYDNRTALHLAASMGKLECVNALMAAKASLDIEDRWGNTPLHVRSARVRSVACPMVTTDAKYRWGSSTLYIHSTACVLQSQASSPVLPSKVAGLSFLLMRRSHSKSFTRAQGIPLC